MLGNDEKGEEPRREEHRVAFSSQITGGGWEERKTKRDGPIEKEEDHRDGKGRTMWGKERMEACEVLSFHADAV